MSARITPLRLEAFEQLPKHARRCVFWEVDPSTSGRRAITWPTRSSRRKRGCPWSCSSGARADRWRCECGPGWRRIDPRRRPTTMRRAWGTPSTRRRGRCRARGCFPTGPVSADAVLLTSIGCRVAATTPRRLPRSLIAAVVGDLVRRGVRALEAFGRTPEASELPDPRPVAARAASGRRGARRLLGRAVRDRRRLPADVGFKVVAPHRYFPRLRLELEQGLGWKADVEAALERLLETAQLQQPVGAGASRRDPVESAQAWADAAGLFDRQLVREQFGEGERAGGAVVLAEQVEPLDRGQDALGDRVAGLRATPAVAVARIGDVADVDLDGGHPGQPQQIPGPAVRAAVA